MARTCFDRWRCVGDIGGWSGLRKIRSADSVTEKLFMKTKLTDQKVKAFLASDNPPSVCERRLPLIGCGVVESNDTQWLLMRQPPTTSRPPAIFFLKCFFTPVV